MEIVIIEIAKRIENAGGRMYLVGGAVRDMFLEKTIHDRDYCVTGISQAEFKNLFPEAHLRGKDFPVYDIDKNEIALARTERKTSKGHKGFEIKTDKKISIEQDLARRDITINSIAIDILTNKIIDPFNGVKDIKNKLIRATTDSFSEDPLRVYRVARFAAQLEFEVEENTLKLMNSLKAELSTISKERVFTEFRKALKTEKPSIFFDVLKKADVLEVYFKEIADLIGAEQPVKYHPEGDSFIHTMEVVDRASKVTDRLEIRYSALVHDLGKGVTPKEEYPHHHGHDIRGIEIVKRFSNRIGVPSSWNKCGVISSREHMLGGFFWNMTPAKQVDFLERVNKSILGLEGLQIVVNCDKKDFKEKHFLDLKKPILEEIDGEYIKQKYHIEDWKKLKEKLREERIIKMKEINKQLKSND